MGLQQQTVESCWMCLSWNVIQQDWHVDSISPAATKAMHYGMTEGWASDEIQDQTLAVAIWAWEIGKMMWLWREGEFLTKLRQFHLELLSFGLHTYIWQCILLLNMKWIEIVLKNNVTFCVTTVQESPLDQLPSSLFHKNFR